MRSDFYPEVLPSRQKKLWGAFSKEGPALKKAGFYLAGGTALALQIGHRQSVDFDFFSRAKGISVEVRKWLESSFPKVILRETDPNTVHADIGSIKVSFIGGYSYPLVRPLVSLDGISLAHTTEIGLMKLLAITHRAVVRDYIDLAAIIGRYITLSELLELAQKKYGAGFNPMLSIRALASFEDLDAEWPAIFDKNLERNWKSILKKAVREIL